MIIGIIITTVLFTIFMCRFVGFCSDKNKLQKNIEKYDRQQKLKKYKQTLKNNN
ncbi:hypothetical protein [uncultured Mediterranean phage uvDeep-CGR2-KM19-C269]|nr:hypothetical protein [uncultured Mediterranean phage uvDeep-CGR2-KM19-C269]